MRSSKWWSGRAPFAWPVVLMLACAATACSNTVQKPAAGENTANACTGQPAEGAGETGRTAAELRHATESGAFFRQLQDSSTLTSCRFAVESGRLVFEHVFANGATLQTTSDPRIEYNDQEVRFKSPVKADDAVEILKRVEATAFSGGCGVNWSQPTEDQAERQLTRDTVYRGDTCNCRARVSRVADGRVTGLAFRSAC